MTRDSSPDGCLSDAAVGAPGPIGSAGARGISVPSDVPYGSWHPAVAALQERFGDLDLAPRPLIVNRRGPSDQVCVTVPAVRLLEVMQFLREDSRCRFDLLADLTCVDYSRFNGAAAGRFAVVYNLLSTSLRHRLWVKVHLDGAEPTVASVTSIWAGANWLEREVYDMFGVRFEGHPDLRRILLWEGFPAWPLRKDYPLNGRGERQCFEVIDADSA